MDFFKPITNFFSNLFGGGGGQAAIGGFQPKDTIQVPTIQQPGKQIITPSQTGVSSPAFIGTQPGTGQPLFFGKESFYPGTNITKQGSQPVSTTTPIGNIRPIIPSEFGQPPIQPQPSPIQPQPPERIGAIQIQQPIPKPLPKFSPIINPSVQQFGGGSPIGGAGTGAGTGAGLSLTGTVSGLGQQGVGQSQEEQLKQQKKQPQFQMVTLDQARQLGLQGAGQSGVFKDQQGNFYGISNAQVATQFGTPNAQGIQTITPTGITPTLQPFQTSLATGPISAEALLKGVPEKLFPTYQTAFDNLNTQIQQNLQQQPPLPQQPVVETQAQQQFVANSVDPYGLQAAMDQSRAKYGLPDLENQRINAMRTIQATNDALQKIVKDIGENPDFPKGLANRMITDFSNKNAITLQNLQAGLQILNTQIDQANEAVNREFGIKKFGVEKGISQQEQQRTDIKNQITQFISSKAIANMDDATLQQYAKAGGYTLASLKAIREAVKGKVEDITNISYKEDAQGNVTAIGLDKNNKVISLGTLKGIGTPSKTEATAESKLAPAQNVLNQFKQQMQAKVQSNPNYQWDGFVDPKLYRELLNQYVTDHPGGTDAFLKAFPPKIYLNSSESYKYTQ